MALNVINFTRGITGIMIDLTAGGTHASISAADFVFKVGNNNLPSSWAAAPAPASIAVSLGGGVGGSDRVEITWASGTIANKWLEVQVLANAHTGLTGPDVFFWGNRIADSASGTLDNNNFITNSTDAAQVFASLTPAGAASITNPRDYNRDKTVNSTDAAIVFATLGNLNRLNVGGGGPFAPLGGSFDRVAAAMRESGDGDGIASALATTSDTYDAATPQPLLSPNDSFPPDTTATGRRITAFFQQFDLEESPRQLGAARPRADLVLDALGLDVLSLDEELLDALVRGRRWQSHRGN